jgi:hypothetical protein
VILSKWEESERARTRTRTTQSEDLPRVEIVDLTRAQRVLIPSHHLQLERLDLLQPVDHLDEFFRRLVASERALAGPALLVDFTRLALLLVLRIPFLLLELGI